MTERVRRCLLLLPRPPYPPTDGGAIRSLQFLKALAREFHLDVATFLPADYPAANLEAVRAMCRRVETVPLGVGALGAAAAALRGMATGVSANHARYATADILAAVRRLGLDRYDVAYANHLHMSHALPLMPNAVRVLDTHNNDAVVLARWADSRTNPLVRAYGRRQASLAERMLRDRLPKLDLTMAVSDREAQEFRALAPGANVLVAENGSDLEYLVPTDEPRRAATLLYAGDYRWLPNEDAARFFLDEIRGRIAAQRPDARAVFAGRNPPEWLAKRADATFEVPGFVDDMRVHFRSATIFVVPLRMGGGTRLKILEAMAMKIPIVSTRVGAEGIACRDGEHILLADTPADFAAAVVRLLGDEVLRRRLAENARRLVEEVYDWRSITRRAMEAIHAIADRKRPRA